MSRLTLAFSLAVLVNSLSLADDAVVDWTELLSRPILEPDQPWREVQEFTATRVPAMPVVETVAEWETYVADMRRRTFDEVIFRGEAAVWRDYPLNVEWMGDIDGGEGYIIRKLRFEAVPGMWVPALLYEPTNLTGPAPVSLAVNGHDGAGKVADYKQIRCINQAKRGMIVLNLEWFGMGQLNTDDFYHYRMNQLDLCGTSGIAPFYLAMSRGIDILLQHEHADPNRVAVSGLSGGGWQTIFISSLDERVTLSDPVAGYSSFTTRAYFTSDLGDSEQTPSDLATTTDYAILTASRAPRPTLLTFNDRDNCCFAAGHALPPLLEAARPIYRLYGRLDALAAHINHAPGDHNFEQDNREAMYRMIGAHFYPGQEFDAREIECAAEVKTAEQLNVPLPDDNAGFNTWAKRLSENLPIPLEETEAGTSRLLLHDTVHSRDLAVDGVESLAAELVAETQVSWLKLRIGEWTVPVVDIDPAGSDKTVVLIAEEGRRSTGELVASLVAEKTRVVAVDPFYFGESNISQRDFLYGLLVHAVGERCLGIQADQVTAISRWLVSTDQADAVTVHAVGRRTGLIALVAGALETEAIAAVHAADCPSDLDWILEENLGVNQAPELFCFGFWQHFDPAALKGLMGSREAVLGE
jgi:hypothetical protein